jgi:hypothetical protein
MASTTTADVRAAFASLVEAYRAAGLHRTVTAYDYSTTPTTMFEVVLDADDLVLNEGSPTYGRGWSLALSSIAKRASGHYTPPTKEYLGWTKAEAELSLRSQASGIWATIRQGWEA